MKQNLLTKHDREDPEHQESDTETLKSWDLWTLIWKKETLLGRVLLTLCS